MASAMRESRLVSAHFHVSDNDVGSYGCLFLIRHAFLSQVSNLSITQISLPTRMGRRLLLCTFGVSGRRAAIGTVHLESLHAPRQREEQLTVCRDVLADFDYAVLMGDFNFDATQNYGAWRRGGRGGGESFVGETLENAMLQRVVPEYVDTWVAVHGTDDIGYTFDGVTNPMCVHDKNERMRYDRIMARGMDPALIELLGTDSINHEGVKPSDHYG